MMLRAEVAHALRISKSRVRQLEVQGVLHPIQQGGVHYFVRDQVLEAAKAREGGLAGEVFRLFEQGETAVAVVMQLNADPDYIQGLWESYHRMLGCWVVQGPGSLRAWEGVFRLGELTPHKLLRALELVASSPELRAEMGLPE